MKLSRIRALREDKDFTQQQVASALNLPRRTYANYETNLRGVPSEILCQLADFYNTSTDYLLGRTDDPAPPRGKQRRRTPASNFPRRGG